LEITLEDFHVEIEKIDGKTKATRAKKGKQKRNSL
jgi:hypothetical protein